MTDVSTSPEVTDPSTGEPLVAHIVRKDDWAAGYIEGAEIEALCGHLWVPSRDPDPLPICAECKAILARHLSRGEN